VGKKPRAFQGRQDAVPPPAESLVPVLSVIPVPREGDRRRLDAREEDGPDVDVVIGVSGRDEQAVDESNGAQLTPTGCEGVPDDRRRLFLVPEVAGDDEGLRVEEGEEGLGSGKEGEVGGKVLVQVESLALDDEVEEAGEL
jgi:hypothetical protein